MSARSVRPARNAVFAPTRICAYRVQRTARMSLRGHARRRVGPSHRSPVQLYRTIALNSQGNAMLAIVIRNAAIACHLEHAFGVIRPPLSKALARGTAGPLLPICAQVRHYFFFYLLFIQLLCQQLINTEPHCEYHSGSL